MTETDQPASPAERGESLPTRWSLLNRLKDLEDHQSLQVFFDTDLDAVWEAEWERNLTAAALERVKHQVKAKQFQMFELYVLQQWPVRDVTRMLGVSATHCTDNTVK